MILYLCCRYCPVILTGDFNTEPQSPLYRFMVSQQLAYEGLVTKAISGQQEGGYGRTVLLDKHFFSPQYGITDSCQYHTIVVDRLNKYLQATRAESEVSSSPAFANYVSAQAETIKNDLQAQSIKHDLQAMDDSIVHVGAAVSSQKPQLQAQSMQHQLQALDDSIVHVGAAVSSHNPQSLSSAVSSQNSPSLTSSSSSSTSIQAAKDLDAPVPMTVGVSSLLQRHSESHDSQMRKNTEGQLGQGQFPFSVNTGRLGHPLNVVSAYRHRIERLGSRVGEVTTHHNKGQSTVDYIFYTVASKEAREEYEQVKVSRIRDGKLKLLARYGLMSADELSRLGGIPSATQPSDHLCLVAKFLLQ